MSWNSIGIPSVPNVPRNIGNALIKFGGAQIVNRVFGDQWGIFSQRGVPLLLVDNVVSVKYDNKAQVVNSPIEKGSFTSYNKVSDPFKLTVMVTKASGGVVERSAFLGLLDGFANSTDLFMIITPEAVYPNCSIVGYDYAREAGDGARMIKANIHFEEIREVVVEYKKTKSDSAMPQRDGGKVQPIENKTASVPKASDRTSYLKQASDYLFGN